MIVVAGHLTIAPDKRADAEAAIATLVPLTEAEEGCLQYRYATDILDPTRVNIIEVWESKAAMDTHMGAPHFADFMAAIGTCIGGDVSVVSYEVSSSSKLF